MKGSRNLGLTEGDEQSFVFWNGMCGKATGGGARRYVTLVWCDIQTKTAPYSFMLGTR